METSKGIINYSYDKNGNLSEKINEDKSVDTYVFDNNNKLIQLTKGQYQYDYTYDAEQNRISQKKTDLKDYHYDVWYDYNVDIDVVSDERLETSFDELKAQVNSKEDNGGVCEYTDSASYDVTYYKESEITTYVLERNTEYAQVLSENGKVNVYGMALLQTGNEVHVKGINDSIVAKVNKDKVSNIAYTDYGKTKNMSKGHGYNSELKDETGLIYLRARYYDPEIARFIQIDNNYVGEKETVNTQNRYTYTLNNPYKYVDKDGNISIKAAGGVTGSAAAIAAGLKWDWLNKSLAEFKKLVKKLPWFIRPIALLMWDVVNTVIKNEQKNEQNDNGKGYKNQNKLAIRKVNSVVKCPEKTKTKYEITKSKTVKLWSKTYDFGIGKMTFKKELTYNVKLSEGDKNSFASIGLGENNFNIGFSFGISELVDIATKTGFSVGFGDWGAVKLSISTTIGKITLALGARVETLKFWEDSSLTTSLTSKVYDKDKVEISVVDSAELKTNVLALAIIAIVAVKVIVPLIASGGAIAVGFKKFLETFPLVLKSLEVVTAT